MKKIIHKWFMDWEKEEKWVNEMAAKGLAMTSIGFCRFEFEECMPGEYKYRCELLDNMPNHPESEKYIRFVEETGAEHVATWVRWVYFRKKAEDGEFELFSDNESKIRHLNRILLLLGILGGCNLYIGGFNIFLALIHDSGANYMGIVNLLVGVICGIIFFRSWKTKKKLMKEQQIFEG